MYHKNSEALGGRARLVGKFFCGTVSGMGDQEPPKRRGRPATGVTPKRNIRLGATWDRAEELGRQIAELRGEKFTMTAYVEEALRRENARIERELKRSGSA
jgi:hypothetical protein